MSKQGSLDDDRIAGNGLRDVGPDHLESVRQSIAAPVVTKVNSHGDPLVAMTERGRTYVKLLVKSGLDGDQAILHMAHTIAKAMEEPPVQLRSDGLAKLDGVQTLVAQLDEMGVNRRDPSLQRAIGRAFLTGGMKELERLGL